MNDENSMAVQRALSHCQLPPPPAAPSGASLRRLSGSSLLPSAAPSWPLPPSGSGASAASASSTAAGCRSCPPASAPAEALGSSTVLCRLSAALPLCALDRRSMSRLRSSRWRERSLQSLRQRHRKSVDMEFVLWDTPLASAMQPAIQAPVSRQAATERSGAPERVALCAQRGLRIFWVGPMQACGQATFKACAVGAPAWGARPTSQRHGGGGLGSERRAGQGAQTARSTHTLIRQGTSHLCTTAG